MKTCPNCRNTFKPRHGNQQYCSEACKKEQKASNQKKLYTMLKEFRRGFLHNYKLFESLLPNQGDKFFYLYDLNVKGFNAYCYYGISKNEKDEVLYHVGNY